MSIVSLQAVLRPAGSSSRKHDPDGRPGGEDEQLLLHARDLHPAALTLIVADSLIWFFGLWVASGLRLESPLLTLGFSLDGTGTPLFGL
ncbi:MAG: hypothetical protein ACTIAR_13170, partial [Brachybacterium tyrofermentans]